MVCCVMNVLILRSFLLPTPSQAASICRTCAKTRRDQPRKKQTQLWKVFGKALYIKLTQKKAEKKTIKHDECFEEKGDLLKPKNKFKLYF